MHELAVTQSLLEIALRHAAAEGARRIRALHVVQGELSTFVDASVQYYWDMIAEGTIAEGAQLHFRTVPAEMQCRSCQASFHPAEADLSCPRCGGIEALLVAGDEFYLESLEIEQRAEPQGAPP